MMSRIMKQVAVSSSIPRSGDGQQTIVNRLALSLAFCLPLRQAPHRLFMWSQLASSSAR